MQIMKSKCPSCGDVEFPVRHLKCGGMMRRKEEGQKFSCDQCGYVSEGIMICSDCKSRDVEWISVDRGAF